MLTQAITQIGEGISQSSSRVDITLKLSSLLILPPPYQNLKNHWNGH